MPGDKIGSVRGKKDGSPFQIVLVAEAAERNLLQKGLPVSIDRDFRHVRGKPSRSNGVHLDIVNAPFASQIPGEGDHASLASMIADGLKLRRRASHASHRGDVDNFPPTLR